MADGGDRGKMRRIPLGAGSPDPAAEFPPDLKLRAAGADINDQPQAPGDTSERPLNAPDLPPPKSEGRGTVTSTPLRTPQAPKEPVHKPGRRWRPSRGGLPRRPASPTVPTRVEGGQDALTPDTQAAVQQTKDKLSGEVQHWYDQWGAVSQQLAEKEDEAGQLSKERHDLRQKVADLEEGIDSLTRQLEKLKEEKDKTEQGQDAVRSEIDSHREKAYDFEEQLASLHSDLQDEQQARRELEEKNDDLEATKRALHEELDALEHARAVAQTASQQNDDAHAKLLEIHHVFEQEFRRIGEGRSLDEYIRYFQEQQQHNRLYRDESPASFDSHLDEHANTRSGGHRNREISGTSIGDELAHASSGYDTDEELFGRHEHYGEDDENANRSAGDDQDDTITDAKALEQRAGRKSVTGERAGRDTLEIGKARRDVSPIETEEEKRLKDELAERTKELEDLKLRYSRIEDQNQERDNSLASAHQELTGYKKDITNLNTQIQQLQKELAEPPPELSASKRRVKELEETLKRAGSDNEQLQVDLAAARETLAQRSDTVNAETMTDDVTTMSAQSQLRSAVARINELEQSLKSLGSDRDRLKRDLTAVNQTLQQRDTRDAQMKADDSETTSAPQPQQLGLSSTVTTTDIEPIAESQPRSVHAVVAPRNLGELWRVLPWWSQVVVVGLLVAYSYMFADLVADRHEWFAANNFALQRTAYGTLGQRKGWAWLIAFEELMQVDSRLPG